MSRKAAGEPESGRRIKTLLFCRGFAQAGEESPWSTAERVTARRHGLPAAGAGCVLFQTPLFTRPENFCILRLFHCLVVESFLCDRSKSFLAPPARQIAAAACRRALNRQSGKASPARRDISAGRLLPARRLPETCGGGSARNMARLFPKAGRLGRGRIARLFPGGGPAPGENAFFLWIYIEDKY